MPFLPSSGVSGVSPASTLSVGNASPNPSSQKARVVTLISESMALVWSSERSFSQIGKC